MNDDHLIKNNLIHRERRNECRRGSSSSGRGSIPGFGRLGKPEKALLPFLLSQAWRNVLRFVSPTTNKNGWIMVDNGGSSLMIIVHYW